MNWLVVGQGQVARMNNENLSDSWWIDMNALLRKQVKAISSGNGVMQ